MTDSTDPASAGAPAPTRWDIRRAIGGAAVFISKKGRRFSVGDRLNLPPPFPRGSTWTVIAIEPAETDGCDATLVVEPADGSPLLAEGQ